MPLTSVSHSPLRSCSASSSSSPRDSSSTSSTVRSEHGARTTMPPAEVSSPLLVTALPPPRSCCLFPALCQNVSHWQVSRCQRSLANQYINMIYITYVYLCKCIRFSILSSTEAQSSIRQFKYCMPWYMQVSL